MPSKPSFDLSGICAVVTGGAQGLGFGLAEAFIKAGARVAVIDRNGEGTDRAAAAIQTGGRAIGIAADVTNESSVRAAVDAAVSAWGRIDLLVNNAGILSAVPVVDMEVDEWRRVIDVNATGTFLMSREVARHMIAKGVKGSIVSIASIAGKIGDPLLAHYSASKFAVVGFTQSLARELGPHGITVNALCPGVVDTPMIHALAKQSRTSVADMVRLQAIARPQEMAEIALAVAFLHLNRAVTGQAINVDGGTVFN